MSIEDAIKELESLSPSESAINILNFIRMDLKEK